VLAASLGGVQALGKILSTFPADFPVPLAIVQHRSAKLPHLLSRLLGRKTALRVKNAEQGEPMRAGTVYIAPPDQHLIIKPKHQLGLTDGRKIRHLRSSTNPLFSSAAKAFKDQVIAVVLTGGDSDATDGVQDIKSAGGIVIAQDETTSAQFAMPRSAIATGCVDYVLPVDQIGPTILRLANADDNEASSGEIAN
jgi:two-component system chemotaxis response regulator CheB